MIDFLVRLKLTEHFDTYRAVNPFYIPIFHVLLKYYVKVQVPADLLNDLILSINQVGNYWFDSSFHRFVFMFNGGQFHVILLLLVV